MKWDGQAGVVVQDRWPRGSVCQDAQEMSDMCFLRTSGGVAGEGCAISLHVVEVHRFLRPGEDGGGLFRRLRSRYQSGEGFVVRLSLSCWGWQDVTLSLVGRETWNVGSLRDEESDVSLSEVGWRGVWKMLAGHLRFHQEKEGYQSFL